MTQRFADAYFHEAVLTLPGNADAAVEGLLARGILGGLALGRYFDGMDDALLVCATEKRTDADIDAYAAALEEVLA